MLHAGTSCSPVPSGPRRIGRAEQYQSADRHSSPGSLHPASISTRPTGTNPFPFVPRPGRVSDEDSQVWCPQCIKSLRRMLGGRRVIHATLSPVPDEVSAAMALPEDEQTMIVSFLEDNKSHTDSDYGYCDECKRPWQSRRAGRRRRYGLVRTRGRPGRRVPTNSFAVIGMVASFGSKREDRTG